MSFHAVGSTIASSYFLSTPTPSNNVAAGSSGTVVKEGTPITTDSALETQSKLEEASTPFHQGFGTSQNGC